MRSICRNCCANTGCKKHSNPRLPAWLAIAPLSSAPWALGHASGGYLSANLKNREDFLNFLNRANRTDGGHTAALDSLGVCLGETVRTFLGPGRRRGNPRQRFVPQQCD